MSQRNYICDLVRCAHWDSILNANDELTIKDWNKECQECCHARGNQNAERCNYMETNKI